VVRSVVAGEEDKMAFEQREVYCPGHFGNSYEVMWPRELRSHLEEMG
jgi:hypothetical protein